MDNNYKNIEKQKTMIVFNNMVADMLSNKKVNPVVTELFIRGRKLNISLVFITQSYFAVLKDVRLNFIHYFIMKTPNKQELQEIAFNHASDIDVQDSLNLYKQCAAQPHLFFANDTTLASDNSLHFRNNFLERI